MRGKVEGCSLDRFEAATGLKLMDANGIKDELPPITTFLNRLLALTIELQGILFTAFEQLLEAKVEGAIDSGVYDVGLETLTAESFVVTDRRTIYTHPGTGAETRLLTIAEQRRNRPMPLDDALPYLDDRHGKLLVNGRSGRAAVQMPAPSLMLDDGEIERRVRLIRPMEQHHASLQMMDETHWEEADRAAFAAAWTPKLAEVPDFADSTLHIVTGLLLPIWKRLPNESTRVYRLQTDDGERIIGRRVSPAWAANAATTGTASADAGGRLRGADRGPRPSSTSPKVSSFAASGSWAHTASSSAASPSRCASGCGPIGLFSEIISWKLRFFVPADAAGPAVLGKLLDALSGRASLRAGGSVMARHDASRSRNPSRPARRGGLPPLSFRRPSLRAATGTSATCATRPAARCSCGSKDIAARARPASGRDAATGEHGDLLDVIRETLGLFDFADVAEEARSFLSLPHPSRSRRAREARPRVGTVGIDRAARRLFAMSRPIPGTLARDLPAAPRHHSLARSRQSALPSALLLPARRSWPDRDLAGDDRRRHRSRRPDHRRAPHLARPLTARARPRSTRRARPWAICSATPSASACRAT